MKKILTITSLALFANFAVAQDAASKGVRFGLKVTPSLNWYKPGEKMTERNGIAPKFGAGLMVEFRLTDVAVLATGLQLDLDGGKVKYKNDVSGSPSTSFVTYYYDKEEDQIADYHTADNDWANNPSRYDAYLLNERKYSVTYVTLPLCLKLKTREIGSLTYFGMVGVNTSVKYSSKATDEVQQYNFATNSWGTPQTVSKTKIKDMAVFNESLNMGAGAEWNLSGSTSLVFGLNYILGFTNVAKSESDYLRKQTVGVVDGTELKQNLKSNSIGLTIGVLF